MCTCELRAAPPLHPTHSRGLGLQGEGWLLVAGAAMARGRRCHEESLRARVTQCHSLECVRHTRGATGWGGGTPSRRRCLRAPGACQGRPEQPGNAGNGTHTPSTRTHTCNRVTNGGHTKAGWLTNRGCVRLGQLVPGLVCSGWTSACAPQQGLCIRAGPTLQGVCVLSASANGLTCAGRGLRQIKLNRTALRLSWVQPKSFRSQKWGMQVMPGRSVLRCKGSRHGGAAPSLDAL